MSDSVELYRTLVTRERKRLPDPVQGHHVLALAGEPAAVDDTGLAAQDRFEEARPVVGVVLEVGVLNQDEIAVRLGQPGADRGALALVHLVVQDPHRRVLERIQHLVRAVAAPVVDHNDLEHQRQVDRPHAPDDLGHGRPLVEDRHDDAECPVGPLGGGFGSSSVMVRSSPVRSSRSCARAPLEGRSWAPSPARAGPG